MSAYDDLFGGNALLQSSLAQNQNSHSNSNNLLLHKTTPMEIDSINASKNNGMTKKKGLKSSIGGEKVSTTARRVPVIPASWTQRYQSTTKPTPPTVVKSKVTAPTLAKSSEKILSTLEKKQGEQQKLLDATGPVLEEQSLPANIDTVEKSGSEKLNVPGKKKSKKPRGTTKSYYEETYDPSRPNDYEAYKKWRKEIHLAKHPGTVPEHSQHADSLFPPEQLLFASDSFPSIRAHVSDASVSSSDGDDSDDLEDMDPLDGYPLDPPLDASRLPEFLRYFVEGIGDQYRLKQALIEQLERMNMSRVVLLCNMVDPGDVDPELKQETSEECTKFGKVLDCHVHEIVGPQLPSDAVRIFVEFDTTEAARYAVAELNGRFFSGRKVSARLYDNQLFHQRAYEE